MHTYPYTLFISGPWDSLGKTYWSGLPFPSPGNLPDPGIKPTSLESPALAGEFFTARATWDCHKCIHSIIRESKGLRHLYQV